MRKKSAITILIGLLLIAAALALVGYNRYESAQAGRQSAQALSALLEGTELSAVEPVPDHTQDATLTPSPLPTENELDPALSGTQEEEIPDYILNPEMDMPTREAEGYQYIAVLDVPTLGLQLPVMERWDMERLKVAPCRYHGSIYTHDLVIAGHAYETHFWPLHYISLGDPVYLTDMDGNLFTYEVVEVEVLRESDVSDMNYSGYALTLFTCAHGGNTTRLAVRCDLLS